MIRTFYLVLSLCVFLLMPHKVFAAVQIIPHKAHYKITMGKLKAYSSLQDVSGSMIFDWSDTCDGWAQQQHIDFNFLYASGDRSNLKSSMMSWEAKDGQGYNFYIKRRNDEGEEKLYKGKVDVEGDRRVVLFALPEEQDNFVLPQDVIFPAAHTIEIIEKAKHGEKLFTRTVFDGVQDDEGDKQSLDIVSTFISKQRGAAKKGEVEPALIKHKLLKKAAWPVRMAFHEYGAQKSQPDYEMDMLIQEDGIVRKIELDYGAFTIVGTLEKIEEIKLLKCPKE